MQVFIWLFVNSQNEMSGPRDPSLSSTTSCRTVCAAFFAKMCRKICTFYILLSSHSIIAVDHCGEFKTQLNLNSWIINLVCKITFQRRKACLLLLNMHCLNNLSEAITYKRWMNILYISIFFSKFS